MHFRIASSSIAFFSAQGKIHLHFFDKSLQCDSDPDYVIKQIVQVANLSGLIYCHFPQTWWGTEDSIMIFEGLKNIVLGPK